MGKENTMGNKPECKLSGENGNVFKIVGAVSRTLKRAGQPEQASEFTSKAFKAGSYDEVLRLAMSYVDVS